MTMKINNTVYNQPWQPAAQRSKTESSTFSLPDQAGGEAAQLSVSEAFEADCGKKGLDGNSNEVQKAWLSNAMQLPEGIGMTGQRIIEFLESKSAPIIYNFEELYQQFGIDIHWEYENGHPVRGIVDNSAANHRAFVQMKAYMDKIAYQQIAAGNKYVTSPDSVVYEGLY